jgi:hypothetical protein
MIPRASSETLVTEALRVLDKLRSERAGADLVGDGRGRGLGGDSGVCNNKVSE